MRRRVMLCRLHREIKRGSRYDRFGTGSPNRLVLESVGPTRPRPRCHDGDLVAAICLDAVYRAAQSEAWNNAYRITVDVFVAHYSADLVLPAAGISR